MFGCRHYRLGLRRQRQCLMMERVVLDDSAGRNEHERFRPAPIAGNAYRLIPAYGNSIQVDLFAKHGNLVNGCRGFGSTFIHLIGEEHE